MATKKYLDENGLLYFWQKIKNKFVRDEDYVHTDNNFTTVLKDKLDALDENGEENVIETVKVNGTALTPDANKAVNVTVPTATSDLTNDSNFVADANYVHTDNNYTTTEKNKLGGIAAGAEVNTIDIVKVNGTAQTVTDKAVDITVPTNTNQLTNGADFQTGAQVTTAIGDAIAGVTQFDYEVVNELPATGVKGTIYLVAHTAETQNLYDEYLWINNAWEKIGTTSIDLTNYYTKTQTDTLLGAKADTATTYTKTEVDTALGGKADTATTLAGYGITNAYTKTEVDTTLADYQLAAELVAVTNAEIDTIVAS